MRIALIALVSIAVLPQAATSQARGQAQPKVRREIPWLDFSPHGVWRDRSRQVRANRAQLLAARRFSALNAPPLARGILSTTAVSGTIVEPVILFKYQDTPGGEIIADTTAYDNVLFGATPPLGRPYTVRTYYEELSTIGSAAPLIEITGRSLGFVTLSQNEVYYTGGTSSICQSQNPYGVSNCNGIFDLTNVFPIFQSGLREALALLDSTVDWRQFTSHGDILDLVVFAHPTKDGACGGDAFPNPTTSDASNNHIWSHRSTLDIPYKTHSIGPGGDSLEVVDYIIESGVGGASACDTTQIMPVGTVAHETGHGFDLPDLYDTALEPSEGVGEYSLMGSGNYSSPLSPSRMDAWSLSQLGWVNVVPLSATGSYQLGGAPVSDTVFYVRAGGANPRGEYFLLENRQPLQSDSAMIHEHCAVSHITCGANQGGGLLIWHVDSLRMATHGFLGSNDVNAGLIHGLELEQADGLGDLDAGTNRGDAGDPYPGALHNTVFSYNSNPAGVMNVDGSFVKFTLDSIRQITTDPHLVMGFRLRYGEPLVFSAGAHVTVTATPGVTSGSFLAESTVVMLTATPDNGYRFTRWTGDTNPTSPTLTLTMTRPFTVSANVIAPLTVAALVAQLVTTSGTLGAPDLASLDVLGNRNGFFDVGDFLAWVKLTGAAPAPPSAVVRR